uniref:Titin n=1 Tax=Sinocyclocheilus anshuiensis TaxID=1608454 RepID=A0A671KJP4_9TELE
LLYNGRFQSLMVGAEYYFRVSAENERGIGEPAETPEPIKASQAPSAPDNLIVSDVSKDTATLAWTKPKYDGGSRITGYVIEAQLKDSDQWTHVTTIKALDYTATELVENAEYVFRIFAVNSSGRSEPQTADIPGSIIIEDKLEAPDIDLDADLRKMITVRAGGSLRLFVPIRGRPTPEVKWGKAEGEINEAAQIDITSSFTSLIIENVNRFDSGKYTLTLENASGTKSAFISVRAARFQIMLSKRETPPPLTG